MEQPSPTNPAAFVALARVLWAKDQDKYHHLSIQFEKLCATHNVKEKSMSDAGFVAALLDFNRVFESFFASSPEGRRTLSENPPIEASALAAAISAPEEAYKERCRLFANKLVDSYVRNLSAQGLEAAKNGRLRASLRSTAYEVMLANPHASLQQTAEAFFRSVAPFIAPEEAAIVNKLLTQEVALQKTTMGDLASYFDKKPHIEQAIFETSSPRISSFATILTTLAAEKPDGAIDSLAAQAEKLESTAFLLSQALRSDPKNESLAALLAQTTGRSWEAASSNQILGLTNWLRAEALEVFQNDAALVARLGADYVKSPRFLALQSMALSRLRGEVGSSPLSPSRLGLSFDAKEPLFALLALDKIGAFPQGDRQPGPGGGLRQVFEVREGVDFLFVLFYVVFSQKTGASASGGTRGVEQTLFSSAATVAVGVAKEAGLTLATGGGSFLARALRLVGARAGGSFIRTMRGVLSGDWITNPSSLIQSPWLVILLCGLLIGLLVIPYFILMNILSLPFAATFTGTGGSTDGQTNVDIVRYNGPLPDKLSTIDHCPLASGFTITQTPRSGSGTHARVDAFDYAAPRNTPVVSAHDGFVEAVQTEKGPVYCFESDTGYGTYVRMIGKGPSGPYETIYAHLQDCAKNLLNPDGSPRILSAGKDVIGYVGSTGNSTGDHLHFELKGPGELRDVLPKSCGGSQ